VKVERLCRFLIQRVLLHELNEITTGNITSQIKTYTSLTLLNELFFYTETAIFGGNDPVALVVATATAKRIIKMLSSLTRVAKLHGKWNEEFRKGHIDVHVPVLCVLTYRNAPRKNTMKLGVSPTFSFLLIHKFANKNNKKRFN
jgi:hypothetical protein